MAADSFRINEAVIVGGKPARVTKTKQGASGLLWVQVQFDSGHYDWRAAESVHHWPMDDPDLDDPE
jgi:hypothetical protein